MTNTVPFVLEHMNQVIKRWMTLSVSVGFFFVQMWHVGWPALALERIRLSDLGRDPLSVDITRGDRRNSRLIAMFSCKVGSVGQNDFWIHFGGHQASLL